MARLTKKALIEEIHKYNGNISAVARAFDKSRKWIYQYIKELNPELWEEVIQAREAMKDSAESQLYKNILNGKEASLIFYLKTQAKDRGYIERQEITGAEGGALRFKGYIGFSPDEWDEEQEDDSDSEAED